VRHVDDGRAEPLVQPRHLEPHLRAQRRVEIGQRLVEQEHLGLAHDRAADRDALALAAGQRARLAIQQCFELKRLGGAAHGGVDVALRAAGDLQREAHVLGHRHVRIQRVALEHHRHAALGRRRVGDVDAADQHAPRAHLLEAGDHAQRRRLAAARRPDQHHELAFGHGQVDAVDRGHAVRVGAAQALQLEFGHQRLRWCCSMNARYQCALALGVRACVS
jgi:hypothetical protein